MKKIWFLIPLASIQICALAQTKWSLRQCVDYALKHNIQIKQKQIEKESAGINLHTLKMSRLPDLNASASQSFDFGRSTTREGVKKDNSSSTMGVGISSSMPLFTGFRIPNQIEAGRLQLKAALYDIEKAKEDVSLNIISTFLQVLYNRELYLVAQDQNALYKKQTERAHELVLAGSVPESEWIQMRATLANSESQLVGSKTTLDLSLVDLAHLMELDDIAGFDIEVPRVDSVLIDDISQLNNMGSLIERAKTDRPALKSAEMRLAVSHRNLAVAKSGYYPTLSLGASYNNGYYYMYNLPDGASNSSFSDQMKQNASRSIGLSLSVPVFNRFETSGRVKQAKADIAMQQLSLDAARRTLVKEVQQAYLNAIAAREKMTAAQVSAGAAKVAQNYMKERFDAGKSTSFELNESNNRLVKALSEQIQAKYDFIFRCKILSFYSGKPLF